MGEVIMSASNSLHYELCKLGAAFIRSRKNPTLPFNQPCKYATVELVCCGAELTDVWGTTGDVTVLIEVKTSHADFLADQRKYARSKRAKELNHQIGNYRYYLCPEGIIKEEELPENWGLLVYDGKKIHLAKKAQKVDSSLPMELMLITSVMSRILKPQTFNFREMTEIKLK